MKIGSFLWLFMAILLAAGSVSAAVPQYLGVEESKLSPPETARQGDLISGSVSLIKVGPVPRESSLTIKTEVINPQVTLTIDGSTVAYAKDEVTVNLSETGVKKVQIRVDGEAPTVEKLTTLKVLDATVYVYYDEDNYGDQEIASLTLRVTAQEIRETISSIETAKEKRATAMSLIDSLKAKGVDTVSLEADLQDAIDQIRLAEEAHDEGRIEAAKTNADIATRSLEKIISEASKLDTDTHQESNVKKYLVIGAAVILVLIVFLMLKSKREELG
jgi:hypothetical protein